MIIYFKRKLSVDEWDVSEMKASSGASVQFVVSNLSPIKESRRKEQKD